MKEESQKNKMTKKDQGDLYHNLMLKALKVDKLPKNKEYTTRIASNGDFIVYDRFFEIVGRVKKGDPDLVQFSHSLNESTDLINLSAKLFSKELVLVN